VISTTATAVPLPLILCDYLLFYPFVDMSITDPQTLTNTVTLPRHVSGAGVQIMAVEVAGQSGAGNPRFSVTYTNSNGVAGRQTPFVACNTQTVNGTIITSAQATVACAGPFLPLQYGDTGVRSIQSVTFQSSDIGLIALVLVYPQWSRAFPDFVTLPIIEDDAYLNLICCPNGTLAAAPLHGYLTTVWG
jgi:hypothetical protein